MVSLGGQVGWVVLTGLISLAGLENEPENSPQDDNMRRERKRERERDRQREREREREHAQKHEAEIGNQLDEQYIKTDNTKTM